jgi:hypothetical protein
MAGRDRVAAVKRARERQARVEAVAVRVAKAQRRVDQASARRQRALEVADARVAEVRDEYSREVHALVDTCGSIGYAADVLGLSERDVRTMIRRAKKHAPKDDDRGGADSD